MTCVLIYSGGLDSTVLLYQLRAQGRQVQALSMDYGQRHRRELHSAVQICQRLGVPHLTVDLTTLGPLLTGSSQTDPTLTVPQGHYAAETMKLTVVPNRNMLFLAVAGAYAVSHGADAIAYAAHAGDHAIYPDCRPAFVAAMQTALGLCDWRPLTLCAPFLNQTKAKIVHLGAALDVPFVETWSCYEGKQVHCGRCSTCVERAEAFALAGVSDPTVYQDATFWQTVVPNGAEERQPCKRG